MSDRLFIGSSLARRCLLVALVCVALGAGLAACGGKPRPQGDGSVVARIDGQPVTQAQIDVITKVGKLSNTTISVDDALKTLVDEFVIAREAAKLGVTVDDAAVQARLAKVEKQAGGAKAFDAALGGVGLDRAAFAERLRTALLADKLAASKFAGIAASPAAVRRFYQGHPKQFTRPQQVDLGDIVLKSEPAARAVVRRLAAGDQFAAVARQLSVDPQGKSQGGRMGWVVASSVPPPLDKVVAGLAVGDVSQPVNGFGGWHVLKLYGRRPQLRLPFARVRPEVAAELTRRARATALHDWVVKARQGVKLERLP